MGTRRAWRLGIGLGLGVLLLGAPGPGAAQPGTSPLVLGDLGADLVYTPVPPCRVVDTRGAGGPIAGGDQRDFVVSGTTGFELQGGTAGGCGVPATASAAVLNLVAVGPAGPGDLRAWPFGQPVPLASVLNYTAVPGLNLANGVVVPLCSAAPCTFDVTLQADVSATDVVADVLGYFQGVAAGGISTVLLQDAAVTGPKLAPSAVDASKLAPAAVTAAKLAPNAVDSSRIVDGSIQAVDVDLSQVQARVGGSCAVGSAIRAVNQNGTVACQADTNSGGTVTSITAGTGLTGGTITTAGTLAVDFGDQGVATTAARSDHTHAVTGASFSTAVGDAALQANTGASNTAVGASALQNNDTGEGNTAIGDFGLASNTIGTNNTATGSGALILNDTGDSNTATGFGALTSNTVGSSNTAIGDSALLNTIGNNNIAVGANAGLNATTGNNNIYIGHQGVAAEGATIRLGTSGTQTQTFIAGISGVTTGGAAVAVLVDGNGQLGTISSSRRVKQEIEDMGAASAGLLRLRPVTFRYRQAQADGNRPRQYGLIAEEVAEVYPELVQYGPSGEPMTVLYHELPGMLLNELQQQYGVIEAQRARITALEAQLTELARRLERLEGRGSTASR